MIVHVVGGDPLTEDMFLNRGFACHANPQYADLICFTGGADVSPELYGEKKHPTTNSDINRDNREKIIFHDFVATPKVGICRGGQFLNVMSGGRMWQDVDNHCRSHEMRICDTNERVMVTSTHHQMIRPTKEAEILAVAYESTRKETAIHVSKVGHDIEVVYYDDTLSLCFQPHPEYGMESCEKVFFDFIKEIYPRLPI
jgi:gamma-glutamyl-gamma-aminobutyrate hydrolase PuuD